MTIIYNRSKQKEKRKYLRSNSTKAEIILWQKIKNKQLGVKFRRQYGIGNYIADFCCVEKRFIIEIDGDYHNESEQIFYDEDRGKDIFELGYKIIRFKNKAVENDLENVLERLRKFIA